MWKKEILKKFVVREKYTKIKRQVFTCLFPQILP
jgi:hypothetical protein